MKIHFLQHVPFEGPGCIGEWAKTHGFEMSFTKFYERDYVVPKRHDYDLLVILGGPMNIYEYDHHPWLIEEKAFIKEAVRDQVHILGICLGAQLLADVEGAESYPGKYKEIGWMPVNFNAEHPLFKRIKSEQMVLHWHGDMFDIPEQATLLASTKACPHQAFVLYDRMVGLQFHFEATEESVDELIAHSADELATGGEFVHTAEDIRKSTALYAKNANTSMFRLLNNMYQHIKVNAHF